MVYKNKISVFYLIRKGINIKNVVKFITSYQDNQPKIDHELVVIYKGFGGEDCNEIKEILSAVANRSIFLSDDGYDITAYVSAAAGSKSDICLFLNSHSSIMQREWLDLLSEPVKSSSVGIVGCTGSWESRIQNYKYDPTVKLFKRIAKTIRAVFLNRLAPVYPNPHIRTNAFIVKRMLFLNLKIPVLRSKVDAYNVESGLHSISRQMGKLGLATLVANSSGDVFEHHSWPKSKTYRSGDQEKLIVSDNQTENYKLADCSERSRLSRIAWKDDWSFY
jgi:hypothetical protein